MRKAGRAIAGFERASRGKPATGNSPNQDLLPSPRFIPPISFQIFMKKPYLYSGIQSGER